jgi:hypothetical protein
MQLGSIIKQGDRYAGIMLIQAGRTIVMRALRITHQKMLCMI